MKDQDLRFFTKSQDGAFFVAVLEDQPGLIVGAGAVFKCDDQALQFTKLAVDEKFRRHGEQYHYSSTNIMSGLAMTIAGIGSKIFIRCLQHTKDGGYSILRVWTSTGQLDAISLYQKFGLEPSSIVPPEEGWKKVFSLFHGKRTWIYDINVSDVLSKYE